MPVYIDDVAMSEIKAPEVSEDTMERIVIQNKKVTDTQLIYNVFVSEGTQGQLITTLNTGGGVRIADTRTSNNGIHTITIPLSDGEKSGSVEFSLVDIATKTIPLSLPVTDKWDTTIQNSSQIILNFNTYPLYVGNASTTDFTSWDGYGATIDLIATVSGEYTENDITWTISDKNIASITARRGDKTDTCTVTVTNGIVKVDSIDLEAEKTIDIDEVYQFTPTVTENATDGELIWLDTDENMQALYEQRGDKIFIMNFSDKEKTAKVKGENITLKSYEVIMV